MPLRQKKNNEKMCKSEIWQKWKILNKVILLLIHIIHLITRGIAIGCSAKNKILILVSKN
jgi:hypothetical protein